MPPKEPRVVPEERNAPQAKFWKIVSLVLFLILAGGLIYYFSVKRELDEAVDEADDDVVVYEVSDMDIKEDIQDQLVWDTRVLSENVRVSVADGEVTLSGEVESYLAKKAAAQSALDVAGVISVDNELMIELPADMEGPDDAVLADRVEESLEWDSGIDSTDITVRVVNGVVTLEGTIDALWKKTRAEDLTYNIWGVYNVNNELAVVYTEEQDDEEIANNILRTFERNVLIDEEDINVSVSDGVVTLTGKVYTFDMVDYTEEVVENTQGVTQVYNEITVE